MSFEIIGILNPPLTYSSFQFKMLAYFAMQRWLEDFAYRIERSGWTFIYAGLAALGIALLTVSSQALRA
jgi:hypothetical protein